MKSMVIAPHRRMRSVLGPLAAVVALCPAAAASGPPTASFPTEVRQESPPQSSNHSAGASASFPTDGSTGQVAHSATAVTPTVGVPASGSPIASSGAVSQPLPPIGYTRSFGYRPPVESPSPASPGPDTVQDRTDATGEGRSDWILSLEAVTNVPADVGGRVTLEFPFRLRVSSGFGVVPGAYIGLINSRLESGGAYDELTSAAIAGSFGSGTVWRSQAGIRPFENAGFYIDGGYARARLRGDLVGDDVAGMVGGNAGVAGDSGYELRSTIHMWAIEVGWQAVVAERLVLGIGLGVLGTISAQSRAKANFDTSQLGPAEAIAEDTLRSFDREVEQHGYLPTLTVRLGFDLI